MGDVTSEHKLLLSVRYRMYTQYTQYTCVGSCVGIWGNLQYAQMAGVEFKIQTSSIS